VSPSAESSDREDAAASGDPRLALTFASGDHPSAPPAQIAAMKSSIGIAGSVS
jgi:hypothetical protein